VRKALLLAGRDWRERHLWHRVKDPFWKLVGEVLLTRTTRVSAEKALEKIMRAYPTPESLAAADLREVEAVVSEVGLKKRALTLMQAARLFLGGDEPPSPEEVRRLPQVGSYISDAYSLYALSLKAFPRDANIERVFYRSLLGSDPPGRRVGPRKRRRSDPYKDEVLTRLIGRMTEGLGVEEVKGLHQGALLVAWSYCRGKPLCLECPLREVCSYRSKRLRL